MLPEAGAFELVFLAMVALIVVGPKDLPVLLRKLGQFTAKMRGLAAEFRASFDEMARQSELDELRREVDALRAGQLAAFEPPRVEAHIHEINAALTAPHSAPAPAVAEDVGEPMLPFDAAPREPEPREPEPRESEPRKSEPRESGPERHPEPTLAHEPQA